MAIAIQLVRLIPSQSEQKLALFWLKKLLQIKSEVPHVKKGRNDFLEYYLNVLRDAAYMAALRTSRGMHLTPRARLKLKEELRHIGQSGHKTYIIDELLGNKGPMFVSRWSADKKTYVSMQPIPGRGALVYMAVTDCAQSGWDLPQHRPEDFVTAYLSSP